MQLPRVIQLFLLLTGLSSCGRPAPLPSSQVTKLDTLAANFLNPPPKAKPRTWFHAMSANMSRQGITKDLESMAEVGIGGLLLFNVTQGIPLGKIKYDSDEHHELIAHAAAESERLGLEFGVHNCDGWTSSGGPWVSPAQSMKMLVHSEVTVCCEQQPTLTQPTTREGYYQDIAVLAYPALPGEIDDRDLRPVISASEPDYELSVVTDGLIEEAARLSGEAPWIQFSYEQPKTIRSASATFTDRHAEVVLQRSDDGRNFLDAFDLTKVRTGKGEWAVNGTFAPLTARHFRLRFNRPTNLKEVSLRALPLQDNLLGRTSMARTSLHKLPPVTELNLTQTVDPETVVDLTGKLDADGQLTDALPPGDWTVLRIGYTSTGATNLPASPEGRGLEVDKLNREAFEHHYENFVAEVVKRSRPGAPNALRYVEIDSYEAGGQNWTAGLDSIFRARKGYDLRPLLPILTGRNMARPQDAKRSGDVATAVLEDYRNLIADLYTENYYKAFTELANADGLQTYVEPYGFGPFNELDAGGTCDLPMGEFWMNRSITQVESAASAAHIYGKQVVSAESFTSQPEINWAGHPALAKVSGDKAWIAGVNEFMFHRFAHQANTNVTPGMTMNRWGFHFDRTQTWWNNAGKAWFTYLARGAYLLQQGHPVADLLIFVGDGAPTGVYSRDDFTPAVPNWLNYDNVNAEVLQERITIDGGSLRLPEGGSYRMLALKNSSAVKLSTLRRLVEIGEGGVVLVGEAPSRLLGYGHSEWDQREFAELIPRLKRHLRSVTDWAVHAQAARVNPDLRSSTTPDPPFEHRRNGDTDIYFLVNDGVEALSYDLEVNLKGRQPELFDAMTGDITALAEFKESGKGTRVRLQLPAGESAFLVFRKPMHPGPVVDIDAPPLPGLTPLTLADDGTIQAFVREEGTYIIPMSDNSVKEVATGSKLPDMAIAGPWEVSFTTLQGEVHTERFAGLTDWSKHENEALNYFSGTATYSTTFGATKLGNNRVELDLGKVEVVAEVMLNGVEVGTLWRPPYRIDVTDVLQPGENELTIEVTNLWANRLIGDELYPKHFDGYQLKRERNGNGVDYPMPAWYTNNEPAPAGPRSTFTTAGFYEADDELLPSGLLGPVRLRTLLPITIAPAASPR